MRKYKNDDIIPTKEEIREILNQVAEAQQGKNPREMPVLILQAWFAKCMYKAFNHIANQYDDASLNMKKEIEQTMNKFDNALRIRDNNTE
jgi:hypothetical protein